MCIIPIVGDALGLLTLTSIQCLIIVEENRGAPTIIIFLFKE